MSVYALNAYVWMSVWDSNKSHISAFKIQIVSILPTRLVPRSVNFSNYSMELVIRFFNFTTHTILTLFYNRINTHFKIKN